MIQEIEKLETSIPANNSKIIELYNKIRSETISINGDYQRKLVWKKQHKFDFIDTILRNYPFPEIYLAPGSLDQERLILIDEIVDGQQRLTTIYNYIQGTDVFALRKIPIKRFSELDQKEKSEFLNYEVSIRYLKNVTPGQIREIFQRINKTDYALNATERLNAQWGESEFICFCKQIIEAEYESESTQYLVFNENREKFLSFFHGSDGDEGVFSTGDNTRMFALQYIMAIVATIDAGSYFSRNDKITHYTKNFNDAFPQASEIEQRLLNIVNFVSQLQIDRTSRWYNKANLFSLLVELDKVDVEKIDTNDLSKILNDLDRRAMFDELGLATTETKLTEDERKYLDLAREAVNEKTSREYRGDFLQKIIQTCSKPNLSAGE